MNLLGSIRKFVKDEEGQSTTEYILILAVVVMIALKFKQQIGSVIIGATKTIDSDIQDVLKKDN